MGRITNWKQDKGFGFIRPDDGTQDVFVHIRAFKNKTREPAAGDPVSYALSLDKQARLQALSVRFQGEGSFRFSLPGRGTLTLGFVLAYALALAALVQASRLPAYVPLAVLLLSLVTYLAYRKDKRAAEGGRWRTPESSLHILALLGGWPGALIAQRKFRHKSSKTSFRVASCLAVLLNISALAYMAL